MTDPDRNGRGPDGDKTDARVQGQIVAAQIRNGRLAAIVESSDDAIIGKTLAGVITDWNKGAERIYGYKDHEIIGRPVSVLFPPELEGEMPRMLEKIARGEPVKLYETIRLRKDGARVNVSLTVSPIRDGENKIIGASTIAHDITEHKRAEERLREQEKLLNEVGDIAKVGGWEMDLVTGKAKWTKGTYDICEIEYDKPIPGFYEHLEYYLPEYRAMIREKMNKLVETRQPIRFEAALKTAKGNIKWGQACGEAVEKDGKAVILRGTFQDITERKKAEEQTRAAALQLSYLTKYSNDFIILLDGEFRFLEFNERVIDVYGYTREELAGKHAALFRAPQVKESFADQVAPAQKTGSDVFETVHQRKDGTCFPVEISLRVIDVEGRRLYQAIIRDITERKKAEEELKWKTAFLESQVEAGIDGVLVVDSEGKRILINRRLLEMWRVPDPIRDEKNDEPLLQYVVSRTKNPQQFLDKVLYLYSHRDETSRDEIEFKDGTVFDRYSSPVKDRCGTYFGRIWAFRDITERRKMDEAIRKSHEQTRKILESITESYYQLDLQWRIIELNKHCETALKKSREELIGRSIWDFYPENLYPEIHRWYRRALEGNAGVHFEMYSGASGKWYEIHAYPFEAGLSVYFHDITGRKTIEKNLRESERRARAVIDQTFEFIGLMTVDGTLVEANRTALEFSGIRESDVLNKPFWETPWWTHSREMQAKLRESIQRVAQGEFVRFEATHVGKDGLLHAVDFSLKPVKDESGKVVFMVPEGRDITEQKKMEEDARMRMHELEVFYKASFGREERILELKQKIAELEKRLESSK